MNPAEKSFKWFSAFIFFFYYIKPVTWQCKLSNMLWIVPSSNGRKVEKKCLQGKRVKPVEHDLCPWPPRPSPKTTKDFWAIALPPAGVSSQSFALLMPGEDTQRQTEKKLCSLKQYEILFLNNFLKAVQKKKRLFWHPPLLLPSRHKIQIDSEETVDLPTEGKQDSFRFI